MEYTLPVRRLRMTVVLQSIDGGGSRGTIELRNAERVILSTLVMTNPSFYLVGDDLVLCAPTTAFVAIEGMATIGTISDGAGNIIIDNLSVGVDVTEDETHDFEIVLDDNMLFDRQAGHHCHGNHRARLMTHKVGNTLFIVEEPPANCELCGKVEELRPYGPGAKFVCFKCAMKDETTAERMFLKRMQGDS